MLLTGRSKEVLMISSIKMGIAMYFAVLLCSFSVFAQQNGTEATQKKFQEIDTNKDSLLTSEEMQSYQKKKFDELDKSKNGVISAEERKKDSSNMFGKADSNGDSQISRKEALAQFNDYFNSMDTNKDRKVSRDEFEASWPVNLRL